MTEQQKDITNGMIEWSPDVRTPNSTARDIKEYIYESQQTLFMTNKSIVLHFLHYLYHIFIEKNMLPSHFLGIMLHAASPNECMSELC